MHPNLNAKKRGWMEFICEYDFDVHYIKGKENIVVDALSRRRHEFSSMITSTNLRERIMHHLPKDEFYAEVFQLVHSLRPLEGKFDEFSLDSRGLLCHKGHIYVPSTGDLYEFIILEVH